MQSQATDSNKVRAETEVLYQFPAEILCHYSSGVKNKKDLSSVMVHKTAQGKRIIRGSPYFRKLYFRNKCIKPERDNKISWYSALQAAASFHYAEQPVPLIVNMIRAGPNKMHAIRAVPCQIYPVAAFAQTEATIVPSERERKQGMSLLWFPPAQTRLRTVLVSLDFWTTV